MNIPKTQITTLLCAVAVTVFGSAICEKTFGQVEDVATRQPIDKRVGSMSNQSTALLQQPHIKRDLELTQEQIDQLSKIRLQHAADNKEIMAEYHRRRVREMEPAERGELMRELTAKRKQHREEEETAISEILLPFQLERMEQIKVQNQLGRLGKNSGSPIMHPMFRDKLNFTKEQEERIKAKMLEVRKELEEEITELRRKANNEILDELTDEQRKIYDGIIGEPLKKPTEIDK